MSMSCSKALFVIRFMLPSALVMMAVPCVADATTVRDQPQAQQLDVPAPTSLRRNSTATSFSSTCEFTMAAQHFPPRFIKVQPSAPSSVQETTMLTTWQGYNIELFNALSQTVGCRAKIMDIPWARALNLLKQGELTVMSNMSHNAERASFAHFIGPHRYDQMLLIGQRQWLGKFENLSDLAANQTPIVLMQGVYYGEQFAQLFRASPTPSASRWVFVSTNAQKIAMLASGRVELSVEDELTLQQLYQQRRLDPAHIAPLLTLEKNAVYFAFSRRQLTDAQALALQNAWQTLERDGTVQRITTKYFGR